MLGAGCAALSASLARRICAVRVGEGDHALAPDDLLQRGQPLLVVRKDVGVPELLLLQRAEHLPVVGVRRKLVALATSGARAFISLRISEKEISAARSTASGEASTPKLRR